MDNIKIENDVVTVTKTIPEKVIPATEQVVFTGTQDELDQRIADSQKFLDGALKQLAVAQEQVDTLQAELDSLTGLKTQVTTAVEALKVAPVEEVTP